MNKTTTQIIRVAVGASALAAIFTTSSVSLAAAHTQTQSTSPKANAVLKSSPTKVAITFNETLLSSGAALVVRSAKNVSVTAGAPKVDGKTIAVALLPNLSDGNYQVSYRVVSNDGHVVTSSYKFKIKH